MKRSQPLLSWLVPAVVLTAVLSGTVPQQAIAQTSSGLMPPDMSLLNPAQVPNDGSIVTADTISQTGLTVPSLWWAQEQYGGKLLNNWIVYTDVNGQIPRVDLIVNQQVWSLYNYLERYTFVNHFGTTARDFGYGLTRVFNQQQELLAAYACDIPTDSDLVTLARVAPSCNVVLDSSGRGGLSGQSNPLERFVTP